LPASCAFHNLTGAVCVRVCVCMRGYAWLILSNRGNFRTTSSKKARPVT